MRIILFANSIFKQDISNLITDDDYLVRFNQPSESNLQLTANRTDLVFVANTSALMDKMVKHDAFDQGVFAQKPDVVFPYTNNIIKKIKPHYLKRYVSFLKLFYQKKNYNNEAYISLLSDKGIEVQVLPESYYLNLTEKLSLESSWMPSTGLIALYYFLKHPHFKGIKIYLYGFEFKGWEGHLWEREKKFVERLVEKEQVYIL